MVCVPGIADDERACRVVNSNQIDVVGGVIERVSSRINSRSITPRRENSRGVCFGIVLRVGEASCTVWQPEPDELWHRTATTRVPIRHRLAAIIGAHNKALAPV